MPCKPAGNFPTLLGIIHALSLQVNLDLAFADGHQVNLSELDAVVVGPDGTQVGEEMVQLLKTLTPRGAMVSLVPPFAGPYEASRHERAVPSAKRIDTSAHGARQQLQLDPSSGDAPSIVSAVGPVSAMRGMRVVLAEIARAIRSSALALATPLSPPPPPPSSPPSIRPAVLLRGVDDRPIIDRRSARSPDDPLLMALRLRAHESAALSLCYVVIWGGKFARRLAPVVQEIVLRDCPLSAP